MWFATEDGLNRYDGYQFKIYRHDSQDEHSLSDNNILVLVEDIQEDALWVGTQNGGLNRFDFKTGTFMRYQPDPDIPHTIITKRVDAIYQSAAGTLWVGTQKGLDRMDRKTGRFYHYISDLKIPGNPLPNWIKAIHEDKNGNLWVGKYGSGLSRLNKKTERFTHYHYQRDDPNSLSNNKILVIFETRKGQLWIGTDGGGLNLLDREKVTFKCVMPYRSGPGLKERNRILSIFEDRSGDLWVGTWGGGLGRMDQVNRTFTWFTHNSMDSYSLPGNQIQSIFENKTGILWVGTSGNGIGKFDPFKWKFPQYRHIPNNPNSLGTKGVRSFIEDSAGITWIGTWGGGLDKWNRQTHRFTHYRHDIDNPNSLSHDSIFVLYQDRDDEDILWIGTYGGGLNRLDKKNESFRHFRAQVKHPAPPDAIGYDFVKALCEDRSGDLWVGLWGGGLDRFNRHTLVFTHYKQQAGVSGSLGNDYVYSIFKDRNHNIWIATLNGGLNRYNQASDDFTSYKSNPKDSNSISSDSVYSIHEDKNGQLWIGTSRGLNSFHLPTKKWAHYTRANGLPNDAIYGILEDEMGNLWLSTNRGLSKFNSKDAAFSNYGTKDGLPSYEFNVGAYYKNSAGEMYFGTIDGFTIFSPSKIESNRHNHPVYLTGYKIFDKSTEFPSPVTSHEGITLKYHENYILFEYVALNYHSPEVNKYRYKLEGFDNAWVDSGTRRVASYAKLPHGTYTFKVKGSRHDGMRNEQTASIPLIVKPPFWLTWWFKVIVITFILGVPLLIYRRKTRALEREKRRSRELNEKNIALETEQKKFKEAQGQLIQAEKMAGLGTLVAGVAHEINNPTNFTQGGIYNLDNDLRKLKEFLVELAGDDADDEILAAFDDKFKPLFSQLETMKEGTTRIKNIVNDLQTFSRKDQGELRTVNLLEGLESTFHLVQTNFRRNVNFVREFTADPEIQCYPSELNQVYMNLMVNACQAIVQKPDSPAKNSLYIGKLIIQTGIDEKKEHAVIRFRDDGIGMSEETRQKMFDIFFTTKPEGEGTGLGLAISYRIIEKLGGLIEVESQEGAGTCISLYIPLLPLVPRESNPQER